MKHLLNIIGHSKNLDKICKASVKLDAKIERFERSVSIARILNPILFVVSFFWGLFFILYNFNFLSSEEVVVSPDDPKIIKILCAIAPKVEPAWSSLLISLGVWTLGCALVCVIVGTLRGIGIKKSKVGAYELSLKPNLKKIHVLREAIARQEKFYNYEDIDYSLGAAASIVVVAITYILFIIGFFATKAFAGLGVGEIISLIFGMVIFAFVYYGVVYLISIVNILFLKTLLGFGDSVSSAFTIAANNLDNLWVENDPDEKERRRVAAERKKAEKKAEEARKAKQRSSYSGGYTSPVSSDYNSSKDDADWEAGCLATGQYSNVFGDDYTMDVSDM